MLIQPLIFEHQKFGYQEEKGVNDHSYEQSVVIQQMEGGRGGGGGGVTWFKIRQKC